MATLEKVSTLDDMKILMSEFNRLKIKLLFDFYGVLQDFSSKKILPQWLQKKGVNNILIVEKGSDILTKIKDSKKTSVIVYDLETPDLNGLQFLDHLGKNPEIKARCKIILATPRLALDAQDKLLHLGARALISKPLVETEFRVAFGKVGLDY
jgi:CheY-like chemotaxis protein